jgi:hypothetical protein
MNGRTGALSWGHLGDLPVKGGGVLFLRSWRNR